MDPRKIFRSTPFGMTRRHFLEHLAGASALMAPAFTFTTAVAANAKEMQRRHKAVILLWMGGGPSTIDMFDMKPGAATAGPFKPISTSADGVQITEHLPLLAKQMNHLSIIRSMSTREADHNRGRYYMHTGYVPNPNIEHPSYGAVVSHELADAIPWLEIPPFVAIGGGSVGPGFLGMAYAPFVVNNNGQVRDLNAGMKNERLVQRMQMLRSIERSFAAEGRGAAPMDHAKVLDKTLKLMTSKQMEAFRSNQETQATRDLYGNTNFGRGCLMARRLVEVGVPFVEVDFGGWDNHQNIFPTLQNQKLPELDKAWAGLVSDLAQRGLLQDTAVIWMGEFGRTPSINGNAGRDHFARAWSVVVGGAGFKGGTVIGKTSADGTQVESEPYTSQDLMASVLKSLGLSLEKTFTAKNGRPMKIANSGKVIKEVLA